MQITVALILSCSALVFANASALVFANASDLPSAGNAISHATETMLMFTNLSQCVNYTSTRSLRGRRNFLRE